MAEKRDEKTKASEPTDTQKRVSAAVDAWWGPMIESVGPLISPKAYDVLAQSRDTLRRQVSEALHDSPNNSHNSTPT